jgi:hypothetical protein
MSHGPRLSLYVSFGIRVELHASLSRRMKFPVSHGFRVALHRSKVLWFWHRLLRDHGARHSTYPLFSETEFMYSLVSEWEVIVLGLGVRLWVFRNVRMKLDALFVSDWDFTLSTGFRAKFYLFLGLKWFLTYLYDHSYTSRLPEAHMRLHVRTERHAPLQIEAALKNGFLGCNFI